VTRWIAEKRELLTDPEFRALYRDHDAAYDWSPDDPRLPELAARTRDWAANRQPPEAEHVDNPKIAQLAAETQAGAASPAWDRLAQLVNGH